MLRSYQMLEDFFIFFQIYHNILRNWCQRRQVCGSRTKG